MNNEIQALLIRLKRVSELMKLDASMKSRPNVLGRASEMVSLIKSLEERFTDWDIMSQEDQLKAWIKSCPVDYIEDIYSRKIGQRTYVFEISEELKDIIIDS